MERIQKYSVFILIVLAVFVRSIALGIEVVYEMDIYAFQFWSSILFDGGFKGFYYADIATYYPPGYMYVLWVIGFFRDMFELTVGSSGFMFLIKLPIMLCDIIIGCIIYKIAVKNNFKYAFLLALGYVLNPVVVMDSTVNAQVNSVFTLFIILFIYFLTEKKFMYSYLSFTIGLLIKPQMLMFSPILLFSIFTMLKEGGFTGKSILKVVKYIGICLFVILALVFPFVKDFDFMNIVRIYTEAGPDSEYVSINAYNFYSLIGANGFELSELGKRFLFLRYSTWNLVSIVLTVIISIYLLYKKSTRENYFLVAALITVLMFMFVIRSQAHYIFPSLALFLIAFSYFKNWLGLKLYIGFSITFLVNNLALYFIGINDNSSRLEGTLGIFSLINLLLIGYMVLKAFELTKISEAVEVIESSVVDESVVDGLVVDESVVDGLVVDEPHVEKVSDSRERVSLTKLDFGLMIGLTLIYGIIAFTNLGDRVAPQTVWAPEQGDVCIVDLGEVTYIDSIRFYSGDAEDQLIYIHYSQNGEDWVSLPDIDIPDVFTWYNESVGVNAQYFLMKTATEKVRLVELAFIQDGGIVIPTVLSIEELFDEVEYVVDKSSYLNSTYFDEIFYPLTAYQYVNHMEGDEWTHPPLGKVIISWSIKLFGMTPFGWRFPGTLVGCLMIPLIYLFGKQLFKKSYWAFFAAFVFTFDFMHFTHTRIATLDSYLVFFVIAMYYFMYKYYCTSFLDPLRKQWLPLAFSGIFMGLAIATKWQGVYAGGGLAIIFFYILFLRYKESKDKFRKIAVPTVLMCFVFFVMVPLVIYTLSYIPFLRAPGMEGFKSIISNQVDMLKFHSDIETGHDFSSAWYQWPFIFKPIVMYFDLQENVSSTISSFGNPLVWWLGFVAVLYGLVRVYKTRDKVLVFLLVSYFAQYLPWGLVSRYIFIYHYFPSVPFMIMLITYLFSKKDSKKRVSIIYMVLVLGLFIVFYPVLSGNYINSEFVAEYLQWLPSWRFVTGLE